MIKELKDIKSAIHTFEPKDLKIKDFVKTMFITLQYNPIGQSLSSNQIGFNDVRLVVTTVGQPLYFEDPKIINKSKEGFYIQQSCLSIPNKISKTKRYRWIEVKANNFEEPIVFGDVDGDEKLRIIRLNQTATLQQAIDMLDCKTILHNQEQYKIASTMNGENKKYGRNQIVNLVKNNKTIKMKYKRIQPYLDDGWIIN